MIKIDAGNFNHFGDKLCLLKAVNCLARTSSDKVFVNIQMDIPYKKYHKFETFKDYDININERFSKLERKTDGNLVGEMMSCVGFKKPFDVIPLPLNVPYPGQLKGYGLNEYITIQLNSYYYNSGIDNNYKRTLIEMLSSLNIPIVYTGKIEDIKERIQGITYLERPPELSDLQFTSMILANALCHIGADSGMGHLAACFGTPRIIIQDSQFGLWWEVGCSKPDIFIQRYSGRWAKLIPSSSGPNEVLNYVNAIKRNPSKNRGWNNIFYLDLIKNSDQEFLSKSLFSFASANPCSKFIIPINISKVSNTLLTTAAMCDAEFTEEIPKGSISINFGDFCHKLNWDTPKIYNLSPSSFNKLFDSFRTEYYTNNHIHENKSFYGVNFKIYNQKPILGKNTVVIISVFGNNQLRKLAFEYAFKKLQKQNLSVQYIIVEGLFKDQTSQISSSIIKNSNVKYVKVDLNDNQKDLFQKECLWNIGAEYTTDQDKYLVFLDSDCYVSNSDWFGRIKDILEFDERAIVYGGKNVSTFNYKTKEITDCNPTVGKFIGDIRHGAKTEALNFSSGFCYAMTKKVFYDIGGFNPYGAIYGGDTIFIYEISKEIQSSWKEVIGNSHFQYFIRKDILDLNLNFICLPDTIVHVWHGNPIERWYRDYFLFLTNNKIDVRKYIGLDSNGLLYWKHKDDLINFLIEFKNRQDESTLYINEITDYFYKNGILFSSNFDCSLINIRNEKTYQSIKFPNTNPVFSQFLRFNFKTDIGSKSYKLFERSLSKYYNIEVNSEVFCNQKSCAWLLFKNVPIKCGFKTLSCLYSCGNKDIKDSFLEIRLDSKTGPILYQIPIMYTGGWDQYKYFVYNINYETNKIDDTNDIFVVYNGLDSICNLKWLLFDNPKINWLVHESFSIYYSNSLIHQNISNKLKNGYLELDMRILKCNNTLAVKLQSRNMSGGLPYNIQSTDRIIFSNIDELSTNWKPIKIPFKLFNLKDVNPKYIRGIIIEGCEDNSIDIRRIQFYESSNDN